jgi:hypothetical protein
MLLISLNDSTVSRYSPRVKRLVWSGTLSRLPSYCNNFCLCLIESVPVYPFSFTTFVRMSCFLRILSTIHLFWVDHYCKLKQREEIDESSLNTNRILLSHFWTKDWELTAVLTR